MKTYVFIGLLVVLSILATAMPALASAPALFTTEEAAQNHCPIDAVVWLNLSTGIYHFKGQRYYANTRNGAYTCMREAIRAGDHSSSHNKQK